MGFIDWSIVVGLLLVMMGVAAWTQQYNKSVVDFLAANRCAGRYLLTVAEGLAMMGTIAFIGDFERHYVSGFTTLCWGALVTPVVVIVALSGWVVYRFRQTRALTLAQFFEIRYTRKFRIFAGFICFVSGILNIGIFPGIASRFFVYFCDLPATLAFGGFQLPMFIVIMFILLTLAVFITLWGGQIAIMITDFLQGVFVLLICVVVSFYLLYKFDIDMVFNTLLNAPKGKSLLNPLDSTQFEAFNPWFFIIAAVSIVYNCMGWQGTQGYNAAARNPHEARMGRILGTFRGASQGTVSVIAAICAYAVMHNSDFSSTAQQIQQNVSSISSDYIKTQMITPAVLGHYLPQGLLGAFCSVMFFAFLGSHDAFLHSWGSIFVQDVVMPLYKKPLSKERHMKWIKMSIIGVACFIFIWSSIFEFNERLMMYVTITNAIFLSGSGAAIIGGLYWKRGTTAAAFTAVIIGAGLTGLGFLLRGIYPAFPIEGHWIFAIAIFISIISYIVVSLLTSKSSFDMDQMLHRGKYAVDGNGIIIPEKAATGWRKWLGISNEFSRRDVFVYLLAFMFPLVYFVAFVVMLLCSIFIPRLGGTFDDMTWLKFWKLYTYVSLILACVFAIWLLIGGSRDVVSMIKTLRTVHRNDVDDGRVSGHHNLADEKLMLAMNENKDQKNDA